MAAIHEDENRVKIQTLVEKVQIRPIISRPIEICLSLDHTYLAIADITSSPKAT
tara:strand:- start:75 stop:236 length:162 start_codon:yes stop_codon:yes gene_type:complete